MPALVVTRGPNRGAIHTLLPDLNRVGRDLDIEITVLDERTSRIHAEIRVDGETTHLKDLNSRNGTWLNGLRCQEAVLNPGDELRVGDVTFLFVGEQEHPAVSLGRSTMSLAVPNPGPESFRPLQVPVAEPPTYMLGNSAPMLELQRRIFKVAPRDVTVLIQGESGTGKELVARALHRNSPRREGPFLALNGAVLGGSLLESELFGHEKGAFTGAVARRQGAFEVARGGTLFLDEIGELPVGSQAALLRVLEGKGYRRVGGSETVAPDVRLVAATNRDLQRAVRDGTFREDLYYRLEVVTLELPPLRERRGDVRLLAESFLEELRETMDTPAQRFSDDALAALEEHSFPGNVRELRNLVERLALFAEGEAICGQDLPRTLRPSPSPTPGGDEAEFPSLRDVEREHIDKALEHTGWNKSKAARLLGIDRVTLYKRIERYGLEP